MAASFIYNGHAAGADNLQDLVPVVQQPSDILIHIQIIAPFAIRLDQNKDAGYIVRCTAVLGDGKQPLAAVLLVDTVDDFKQDLSQD